MAYVIAVELTFAGGWPFAGLSTLGTSYVLFSCAFLAGVGLFGLYFLHHVHTRLNDARVAYSTILFRLGLDEILTDELGPDGFQFASQRGPASEFLRPRWHRRLQFNEGRGVLFVLSFMALVALATGLSILIVLGKGWTLTDFV